MLTALKVFSSSFTISALLVELTGITRSMTCSYSSFDRIVQLAVTPPMILGVFRVFHCGFPGSIRSGEKAR